MDNDILDTIKLAEIYNPPEVILNLIIAFFLGFIISLIYKKTHKGLSYSQSFVLTIIFVSVIVSMVIMVIGNNLARAFALVGALSIIRFRTVVKDTKDTAYIFWSLASGMAAGTGSYFLAIVGNIILSLILKNKLLFVTRGYFKTYLYPSSITAKSRLDSFGGY